MPDVGYRSTDPGKQLHEEVMSTSNSVALGDIILVDTFERAILFDVAVWTPSHKCLHRDPCTQQFSDGMKGNRVFQLQPSGPCLLTIHEIQHYPSVIRLNLGGKKVNLPWGNTPRPVSCIVLY